MLYYYIPKTDLGSESTCCCVYDRKGTSLLQHFHELKKNTSFYFSDVFSSSFIIRYQQAFKAITFFYVHAAKFA